MNRFKHLTQNLTEFCDDVCETVPNEVQESVEVLKVDTVELVPGETYYVCYKSFPSELYDVSNALSFVGRFKHMTGHLKGIRAVFDTTTGSTTIPVVRMSYSWVSCYTTFRGHPIHQTRQPETTK